MKSKITSFRLLKSNLNFPLFETSASPSTIHGFVTWHFWGIWMLALTLIFSIYISVIDVAPYLHIDEFMTVDLGRIILQPNTDWSIAWMFNRDQPAFLISYLGLVFQEFAYQIGGQFGPRISGILGAFVAATAMVGWLLARRTFKDAALILGLAFLLDPIFVQAYTIGRVDGWAILSHVDNIILQNKDLTKEMQHQLSKGGLGKIGTYRLYKNLNKQSNY